MTSLKEQITALVERTRFVDTHEHLLEESTRVSGAGSASQASCCVRDFSALFSHYLQDYLISAGMPLKDLDSFFSTEL